MNASPARHTQSFDPDRAVAELARGQDSLANMQGADSRRIDSLVQDVGEIKGDLRSIKGGMERMGDGVEQLQASMTAFNRHAVIVETQASEIATLRRDQAQMDKRLRDIEIDIPPLKEARGLLWKGMIFTIASVGGALVALVVKLP